MGRLYDATASFGRFDAQVGVWLAAAACVGLSGYGLWIALGGALPGAMNEGRHTPSKRRVMGALLSLAGLCLLCMARIDRGLTRRYKPYAAYSGASALGRMIGV